ncbi:MAG: hypothetical protein ABSH47_19215 [Bryobacteraceae bacterium]|jgi:hypothetical protein
MARKQITPDSATQSRARRRALDPGGGPARANPRLVFDLGRSDGTDIARDKDALIAQAFARRRGRRERLEAG